MALCSPVWRLHRHREQGGERDEFLAPQQLPPPPSSSTHSFPSWQMRGWDEKHKGGNGSWMDLCTARDRCANFFTGTPSCESCGQTSGHVSQVHFCDLNGTSYLPHSSSLITGNNHQKKCTEDLFFIFLLTFYLNPKKKTLKKSSPVCFTAVDIWKLALHSILFQHRTTSTMDIKRNRTGAITPNTSCLIFISNLTVLWQCR